nr:Unknown Function [uncultured bacterium]
MKLSKRTRVISILVFAVIGFILMQIPVNQLEGSKATFTLFDAFAPMAGAILGSIPGLVAVLVMQIANMLVHHSAAVDVGTFIRLLPMLGAVLYFAKPSSKWLLAIPALAILSFNLDPVGRSVWYFSLFWLIPVVAHFSAKNNLFMRSLGATFIAHSIGGAIWVHAFHLPKAVWVSLIPIVVAERLLFAIGITLLYVAVSALIPFLVRKRILPQSALNFAPAFSL